MGNLLGSPLKKYVNGQIKIRQKISGIEKNRTLEDITYLNSRTAFVKLASSIYIEENRLNILKQTQTGGNDLLDGVGTGYDLAIRNVLQGGLVSKGNINLSGNSEINQHFQKGDSEKYRQSVSDNTSFLTQHRKGITGYSDTPAYGVGGLDFGFSPMPGITEVEIKDLNRGSIKKSSLTIKCHNKNQFDIIDVLYLRLGYTVCLEWGWNTYKDNNNNLTNLNDTLIDNEFWKVMNEDYSDFLDKIEKKRKETFGNYDGIIGVISNFSWNFNPDGTYDIKLEITSLGDVIESLKVNLPPLIKDRTDPYAEKRLESLAEELKDRKATQEEFYNVLYPGLEEELEKVYNKLKNLNDTNPNKAFKFDKTTAAGVFYWLAYQYGRKEDFQIDYNNIADIRGGRQKLKEALPSNFDWGEVFTKSRDNSKWVNNNATYGGLNEYSSVMYSDIFGKSDEELGSTFTTLKQWASCYTQVLIKDSRGKWSIKDLINSNNPDDPRCLVTTFNGQSNNGIIPLSELRNSQKFLIMGHAHVSIANLLFSGGVGGLVEMMTGGGPAEFKLDFTSDVKSNLAINKEVVFKDLSNGEKNDVLFEYYTLEKFLTLFYYYTLNTHSSLHAGGEEDERFQPDDGDEDPYEKITEGDKQIITEAKEFKFLIESNKFKNKLNNWFFLIRKQSADNTYNLEIDDPWDMNYSNEFDKGLRTKNGDWVGRISHERGYIDGEYFENEITNQTNISGLLYSGLKANIFLEGKDFDALQKDPLSNIDEIGSILNHEENMYGTLEDWNTTVGFPKYTRSIYETKKRHMGQCDFVKLDIQPIKDSYFVKLEVLLDFITHHIIPKKKTKNSNTPIITIDTDVKTNICYVIDNIIPYNPKKIIFKNEKFYAGDLGDEKIYEKIYAGLDDFIITGENDSYKYGQLMNVYLNMNRVEEIFSKADSNNKITLFKALKDICGDINEGIGYINNIEPIIDKEKNLIKLIDQTAIPNLELIRKKLGSTHLTNHELKKLQLPLEVYGYNPISQMSNFVRNVGITTEISKNYATAITIGATANGEVPGMESTAFSRWNIGLKDRFKDYLIDAELPEEDNKLKDQNKNVIENYQTFIKNAYTKLGFNRKLRDLTINPDYISTSKDIVQNYYVYAQAENTKGNYDVNTNEGVIESSIGFLPINLKLEMDGIGGIRIYDFIKINTEFLPSNYPNTLEFICTGVNHTLSGNDWVTNLKTIATYIDKKSKSTSASS